MIPFVYNVWKTSRYAVPVTVDDPWVYGNSLEWATSCPPPRHNFTELPRIRSERPAFELHYPHMAERLHAEGEIGFFGKQRINSHAAPSQVLTQAVIPGDHSKDNASEQ